MATTLIVIQFILTIFITIAVMLQKSSSIGLGAYSGSNESMFGAKGPANFLARATFVLGVALVVNTVALSYIYTSMHKTSVMETLNQKTTVPGK